MPELPDSILLGSGRYFSFTDPASTPVAIDDIAYGLAYECRFSGQCWDRMTNKRCYYSVAQHCLIMSYYAPQELALAALMHDASEAFCKDIPSPLKRLLPDYRQVEERVETALFSQFGIANFDKAAIKELDMRMLATEQRDLMAPAGGKWNSTSSFEPFGDVILPNSDHDYLAGLFIDRFFKLSHQAVHHGSVGKEVGARSLREKNRDGFPEVTP